MTPMEAWSIVSANLNHLYKIRRADNLGRVKDFKGYDSADTEAEVMCFMALKQMQERPKMNDHKCDIGLLHRIDHSEFVTLDLLKEHIEDRKEFNKYIDNDPLLRTATELRRTEWSLKDYCDKRKATNLRRFDFCPFCGKKIDWAEIRRKEQP